MQDALDAVHPGEGVLFGRPGWTGQQAVGMTWGGDQASDFWSSRALAAATLTAAALGLSDWSHEIGGYLGERLIARCPKQLLTRWLRFGCFTPLMQAHRRFQQKAWTYDEQTLALYRRYVLLHKRLVPYVGVLAAAPLDRIPVFVRDGALIPTHPAARVAGGLGDTPERARPLKVMVFGEPREGAGVTLADGTRMRWRGGRLKIRPHRTCEQTWSPASATNGVRGS